MKIKTFVRLFSAAFLAGAICLSVSAKDKKLEAQAKISKSEAQKIALGKVPGGKIKDSELEEENGKLIWSFDIKTKGTKDITEVNIDAQTGEVVAVVTETPKDEEREAKEEKAEKKHKKHEKEKDDDDDNDEKK